MKKALGILTVITLATVFCATVQAKDERSPMDFKNKVRFHHDTSIEGTGTLDIESGATLKFAGTALTATVAELNQLDGDTGGGTNTTSYISASETGFGPYRKTVLTITALPIVLVEGGTGTNGYGGSAVYVFPSCLTHVLTVNMNNTAIDAGAALDDADGGDISFGSAVASGTALTGTAADFIATTSVDPITNVVDAVQTTAFSLDGTATAVTLYANNIVDDADIAATATNTISGTVTILWANGGDN